MFGFAGLSYLAAVKFGLGVDIGDRPMLMISILLVMLSVQMLTTGVLAELMARSFYASSRRPHYLASEWKFPDAAPALSDAVGSTPRDDPPD